MTIEACLEKVLFGPSIGDQRDGLEDMESDSDSAGYSHPPPPPPARPHLSQQHQHFSQGSSSEQTNAMHGSSESSAPSPSGHAGGTPTGSLQLSLSYSQCPSDRAARRLSTGGCKGECPPASRPEPGPGSSAGVSSVQRGRHSMVQPDGVHKPPQVWPLLGAGALGGQRLCSSGAARRSAKASRQPTLGDTLLHQSTSGRREKMEH